MGFAAGSRSHKSAEFTARCPGTSGGSRSFETDAQFTIEVRGTHRWHGAEAGCAATAGLDDVSRTVARRRRCDNA